MDNLHIVSLEAENVKRLRAVRIEPKTGEPLVVIGGNNAQGKTSVLDSVMCAIGGADSLPEQPLRKGEDSGYVTADLGEIVATRTFKADGKSTLTVRSKDGTKVSGPQSVLDRLYSAVSFDPLEFQRMKPVDQAEVLRKLVGIDTTAIDDDIQSAYNRRTDVNRDVKALEARFNSMAWHGSKFDIPKNPDQLQARLTAEQNKRATYDEADRQVNRWAVEVQEKAELVAAAEEALRVAKEAHAKATEALDLAFDRRSELEPGDVMSVMLEMQQLTAHNKNSAENKLYCQTKDELSALKKKSDELTAQIEDLRAKKEKVMAAAKFPIEGLSFADSGVLYKGVPFEQASGAEKLRISVAIGAALNPKLRVALVRDGSLLDGDNMKLLRELALEHDMQIWVERVGHGDKNAIIIEDGEVAQ